MPLRAPWQLARRRRVHARGRGPAARAASLLAPQGARVPSRSVTAASGCLNEVDGRASGPSSTARAHGRPRLRTTWSFCVRREAPPPRSRSTTRRTRCSGAMTCSKTGAPPPVLPSACELPSLQQATHAALFCRGGGADTPPPGCSHVTTRRLMQVLYAPQPRHATQKRDAVPSQFPVAGRYPGAELRFGKQFGGLRPPLGGERECADVPRHRQGSCCLPPYAEGIRAAPINGALIRATRSLIPHATRLRIYACRAPPHRHSTAGASGSQCVQCTAPVPPLL